MCLHEPRALLLILLRYLDRRLRRYYPFTIGALSLAVCVVAFFSSIVTTIVLVCGLLFWVFLLYGSRYSVVATLLVASGVLLVVFPLFFVIKTCLNESEL